MSKYNVAALLAIFGLLSSTPASAGPCASVSYGAGIEIEEVTPVSAILDAPDSFVGKDVRVEGTVKEVCEMAGCWLELEAAEPEPTGRVLKVKVKDGEIEFPVSARGKPAAAQGKVERLEMSRAKYVKHLKHLAEEQNRKFDEKSVSGPGPFHVYQIAGTGAEICK